MDEAKKMGEDLANETSGPTAAVQAEQKEAGSAPESPRVGIDEKGNLFVQADMRYGYLALIGWLDECKSWLEDNHPGSLKNQKIRAEEKKIIAPKGMGRFNLFRGK